MLRDYVLIAGVRIDSVTGKLKKGSAVGHWEVLEEIEPVGKHYLTSHRGGNGGWVKLYNPFTNVFEEYSYREFTDSMSETGDWGGVWVRRQVKPVLTEQDRLLPTIAQKGGNGKRGDHKPDKNNQSDQADEKKRLAAIEKILNSAKPVNAKTRLLKRAGLSAEEIARRLPKSAGVNSQPTDGFDVHAAAEIEHPEHPTGSPPFSSQRVRWRLFLGRATYDGIDRNGTPVNWNQSAVDRPELPIESRCSRGRILGAS